MPKQGDDLGVELGQVWKAGRTLLPEVADEMHIAVTSTRPEVGGTTRRGAGLGTDPGPVIDQLLQQLLTAVTDTEDALRDAGQALVWTADLYAETDAAAKAWLDRVKADLGEVA